MATIVGLVAGVEARAGILALYPDLEADDVREALLFTLERFGNARFPSASSSESARTTATRMRPQSRTSDLPQLLARP